MGIKILTLATHALNGKPIYLRRLERYARVFLGQAEHKGRTIPQYELEFVDKPEEGRFPVKYDMGGQGHVVVGDITVDDVCEEDEVGQL